MFHRGLPADLGDAIQVLSWNILADCFLESSQEEKHESIKYKVPWAVRFSQILDEILSNDADVLFLQEVMFTAFDADIFPALTARGFAGLMQADKSRSPTHPVGVATFWKTDSFELVGECHRSRTSVALLRDPQGRVLACVNCHLEGNPKKSVARVKQLQTTLRELSKQLPHQGLIIAGDFNCQLGASACSAYLSFGQVVPGVREWDCKVPEDILAVPDHGYDLASAYPPTATAAPGENFTYCAEPGRPVDGLDQVWYSARSLTCLGPQALFRSDEQRLAILESGLPSSENASDHIPVGAVFRWLSADMAMSGSGAGTEAGTGAGPSVSTAVQEPQGTGSQLPDLGNLAVKRLEDRARSLTPPPLSPGSLAEEMAQLLTICPFDDDVQRLEFMEVTADIPGLPSKGKPTPEQLALLKHQRERKTRLLASLNDDALQIVNRVLELKKKAKKRAGAKPKTSDERPGAGGRAGAAAEEEQTSSGNNTEGKSSKTRKGQPAFGSGSASAAQEITEAARLKILVLHGWGQDGAILEKSFKRAVKKLTDAGLANFYFLTAPHALPLTSIVELDGLAVEVDNFPPGRKAHAWFLYTDEPEDGGQSPQDQDPLAVPPDFCTLPRPYHGLQESLDAIGGAWEDHGPFDGVLGFSQGAVVCHILAALRCGLSSDPPTALPSTDDPCLLPATTTTTLAATLSPDACPWLASLKFAIVAAGFPACIEPHPAPMEALDLPSLHISGQEDSNVPPELQRALASCFVASEMHVHTKGHTLPSTAADVAVLAQFLRQQQQLLQQPPPLPT